jgi:hypothetical protein
MEHFLHVGRITLIVGGLLLAIGSGLQAATSGGEPFSVQVTTSVFAASAALRLAGAVAMIIGLTALYLPVADRAGRFGLVAYYLVVANLVMQAGWMWADLFITRAFAANAPGVLDGTAEDGIMGIGFMLAWLLNATLILLGIALLRSRTYPRGVGIAVIVMGAITLLPMPFDGPVFEVIIGSMAALAGVLAVRTAPAPITAPALEGLSPDASNA